MTCAKCGRDTDTYQCRNCYRAEWARQRFWSLTEDERRRARERRNARDRERRAASKDKDEVTKQQPEWLHRIAVDCDLGLSVDETLLYWPLTVRPLPSIAKDVRRRYEAWRRMNPKAPVSAFEYGGEW